ncbi:40-kDa huntingtin-associated protein-like [Tachyglossus aculeatus]|uniref:40-kDa huntingtin-associated protein-like n=1 Tax=Tachyglossus aculeatus TaxID=9261 RepID=UPI0018F4C8F6|nr:40-kDa huntingtin-associated protein-like [Tachyglossus aculeatus]
MAASSSSSSSSSGPGVGGGPGPDGGDFLSRYRLVSTKLKKRFLRKPNVSEAGEQFGQLGKELRAAEWLPYAAWCQLAVARCQQSLLHGPGEALALTEAARLFLRQEREARLRLACPAAWGEPLQAAAACLAGAANANAGGRPGPERAPPKAGMAAVTAAGPGLELAAALAALGRPGPAAAQFVGAARLLLPPPSSSSSSSSSPPPPSMAALWALGRAASCCLLLRDHDAALTLLTRLQRLARAASSASNAALADVAARCEVTRVLLLLLLQPPPPKLLPEHARTLERYCWDAQGDGAGGGRDDAGAGPGRTGEDRTTPPPLPEGLFLLLQSLVVAAHEKDVEAVKVLQVELWPLLCAEQNHLLHLVLQEMMAPSGQGI